MYNIYGKSYIVLKFTVIESACIPFLILAIVRPMVRTANPMKINTMTPTAVKIVGRVTLSRSLGNWLVAIM